MRAAVEHTSDTANRVGENVRRLRIKRFGSIKAACKTTGISIPRWYRLEQGNHPGMLGDILDELSRIFEVDVSELVTTPRRGAAKPKRKNKTVSSG